MKKNQSIALVLGAFTLCFNAYGQLPKISKPKINVYVPGNSDVKASDVGLGGKDPSGLFKNITNDESANVHRKNAVTNLAAIEAEYAVVNFES
jgi:hypothetical protein